MPVHVGEMITEATVEPDIPGTPSDDTAHHGVAAPVRDAKSGSTRDRKRTAAEGYDD